MEPATLTIEKTLPRRLAEGVYRLTEGWEGRYLIQTAEANILVDTPPADDAMFAAIRALGGAHILFITHRDTVGDAWMFYEHLGVRVAIHPDDADYVTGCPVEIHAHDGDHLTPETRVIHAPGHSPGSCALLLERDHGYLFTGDVVITDEHGELRLPLEGYSEAPRRARDAVSRLQRHAFDALLPAHGAPILTDAAERLKAFLARHPH